MTRNKWGKPVAWLAAVAASAALVACGGGADASAGNDTAKSSGGAPAAASGKAQTVSVVLKDNVFAPKEITVEEGTVTFNVKNEGAAIHNFVIKAKETEGKDIVGKAMLQGGESDTFTATFTKDAKLQFQCTFHLPDMVGTLTVK